MATETLHAACQIVGLETALQLDAVRPGVRPGATTSDLLSDAALLLLRAEAESEADFAGLTLLRMGMAALGEVRV